jgi:hypothetical protein
MTAFRALFSDSCPFDADIISASAANNATQRSCASKHTKHTGLLSSCPLLYFFIVRIEANIMHVIGYSGIASTSDFRMECIRRLVCLVEMPQNAHTNFSVNEI